MVREVYAEVGTFLEREGFGKAGKEAWFKRKLSDQVVGVVGISDARRGTEIAISVGVGLICPRVEQLIADWCNVSSEGTLTTYGNVGYLRPERRWIDARLGNDGPADLVAGQLIDQCASIAIPFTLAHTDLRSVAEVLRQKVFPSMESLDAERLAVIYALLDETQRAEEVVRRLPAWSTDDQLAVDVHDALYREGFLATFAHSG